MSRQLSLPRKEKSIKMMKCKTKGHYFVDVVIAYDGIKESVQVIEKVDHLHGSAFGTEKSESDDIRKENGD